MAAPALSPRLARIVAALPLRAGMRVLEIGGAPGSAARAVAERVGEDGHVLVIDRSVKGVAEFQRLAAADHRLSGRCVAAENFELLPGEAPYDLAFAVRVGVFDGRHPRAGVQARRRVRDALVPGGRLLIDGGDPLREVPLNHTVA